MRPVVKRLPLKRLGLAIFLMACCSCSKKTTPTECDAMLDRYLDLSMAPNPELSHMPPQQVESVISAQKIERRNESWYVQARARCAAEVSRTELECAMNAPTANDWEACID
jgi:hypothetical protein